jgi:hypothetical protein
VFAEIEIGESASLTRQMTLDTSGLRIEPVPHSHAAARAVELRGRWPSTMR